LTLSKQTTTTQNKLIIKTSLEQLLFILVTKLQQYNYISQIPNTENGQVFTILYITNSEYWKRSGVYIKIVECKPFEIKIKTIVKIVRCLHNNNRCKDLKIKTIVKKKN
jgi:hypothetical protein